jgi:hypothetical protein
VLGSGQLGAGSNCSPEVRLPKVFGDGQPGNAGMLQKQNCEGNSLGRFGLAYPFRFGDYRTSAAGQGKVLLMRNSHGSYSPFFL